MQASPFLIKDHAGSLYQQFLTENEPHLLKSVLSYTRGNVLKASFLLGISRNTLRKKLAIYQIDAKKYKEMPREFIELS